MTDYIEFVKSLSEAESEPPILYTPMRVQTRRVTHIAASSPASLSSELSESSFQGMSDIDLGPVSSSEVLPSFSQSQPFKSSEALDMTSPTRSASSAEETATQSAPLMDERCCTCSLQ
jgi:hypothetical protein